MSEDKNYETWMPVIFDIDHPDLDMRSMSAAVNGTLYYPQYYVTYLLTEIEKLKNEYKILESKFDFFYNRLDPEGQQFPPDSKERWG
jgi:hypothetical protein